MVDSSKLILTESNFKKKIIILSYQADEGHRIRFSIDFFRLICPSQYLRIRDGDSLAADLIAEYIGGTDKLTQSVISSESQILVEFYSNELSTLGESCKGGFLTHAQQIRKNDLFLREHLIFPSF